MTEQTQPTDAAWWIITAQAELDGVDIDDSNNCLKAARGALEKALNEIAKWGTPAGAGEPEGWITWFRTPNGSREPIYSHGPKKPSHGAELDALLRKYPLYTTPQPTQAQAGAVPLTQYRVLEPRVDRIEAGDEFLQDDAQTWAIDPNGTFVGTIYGYALRAARRRIAKKEGADHA